MKFRNVAILVALLGTASLAYAGLNQLVEFHPGHTHDGEITVGAPSHSGGIDQFGCHHASQSYHCH